MELAGVFLATPGIVGQLLKVSLEGYQLFSRANALGKDLVRVQYFMEVERERLEDWTRRLSKLGGDLSKLVGPDKRLYCIILETLARIATVFAELGQLIEGYKTPKESRNPFRGRAFLLPKLRTKSKVDNVRSQQKNRQPLNRDGSCTSTEDIIKEIEAKVKMCEKSISVARRLRWSFSAFDEVETMVQNLRGYNDRLFELTVSCFQDPYYLNDKLFQEFEVGTDLPFPRNRNFCGRDAVLGDLKRLLLGPEQSLGESSTSSPQLAGNRSLPRSREVMVLYGMGGIGKSQIMLEYAYQNLENYSSIFWIDVSNKETLATSGRRILQRLITHIATKYPTSPDYSVISTALGVPGQFAAGQLEESGELSPQTVWTAVRYWLSKKGNSKWLLLVDNYDDLKAVNMNDYLPTCNTGTIVVTTRVRATVANLNGRSIEIGDIGKEAGVRLLLSSCNMTMAGQADSSPPSIVDAESIVSQLGNLPLALVHAGSYILTTGTNLQKYALKLCEDKKRVLVNQHNLELMTYELQGVFSCWSFSFAALSDNAQDILKLCSSLGDGDIPMELLYRGIQGVSCLSNNDPNQLSLAIDMLVNFSLIVRKTLMSTEGESLWVHPVLRVWIQSQTGENFKLGVVYLVGTAIMVEYAERETTDWMFEASIATHIKLCNEVMIGYYHLPLRHCYNDKLAENVYKLGVVNYHWGDYETAVRLLDFAIAVFQAGPSFVSELRAGQKLSLAFKKLKRIGDAYASIRDVLAHQEVLLGPSHAETLFSVCVKGECCRDLGELASALELFRRALDGYQKHSCENSRDVLSVMHNISWVFRLRREFDEALKWYDQALQGKEALLGESHRTTLATVHDMAVLFDDQGEYEESLKLFQRALDEKEKLLGKNHPSTLLSVSSMITTLRNQGKPHDALPLCERIARTREDLLGVQHQDTLESVYCLAQVLQDLGLHEQAVPEYLLVYRVRLEELGLTHRDTFSCLKKLTRALFKSGHHCDVPPLVRPYLQMGDDIPLPYSISLQKEIARSYDHAGEFEKAYREYSRLLDVEQTHYGERHQKTLTTVARLAKLLEIRGELEESAIFHRRAWKGRQTTLGANDPATRRSVRAATRLRRQLQQRKLPSGIIFNSPSGIFNSDNEPADSSTPTDTALVLFPAPLRRAHVQEDGTILDTNTAFQEFQDNASWLRRASRPSSIASGHSSDNE